jgi:1-acyl-sn-glycerol-3-phosphate acyltransferase
MGSPLVISYAVVAGLSLALVGWALWAWSRTRFTFFQAFLLFIDTLLTRILWRATVSGPLPVAEGEGAVIVCNHSSGVDPLVIQLCTDRLVHWMVAREYNEMPVLRHAFRAVQSIPVNRAGIDTAATKLAIRLAQQGGLIGLFPEGRVNTTSELLLPGRPGAALIALRARVKVIPCFIRGVPYDGTALGSLFMGGRAEVVVGEPIDLSAYYGCEVDRAVLEDVTRRLLVEIAKLAGVDGYQPRLAGRDWKTSQPDAELANAAPQAAGNSAAGE